MIIVAREQREARGWRIPLTLQPRLRTLPVHCRQRNRDTAFYASNVTLRCIRGTIAFMKRLRVQR